MAVLSRFGFLFRRNTALSDKLLGQGNTPKLYPLQETRKHDQGYDVHRPDRPHSDELLAHGLHIIDPEGEHEEPQVAEQED